MEQLKNCMKIGNNTVPVTTFPYPHPSSPPPLKSQCFYSQVHLLTENKNLYLS